MFLIIEKAFWNAHHTHVLYRIIYTSGRQHAYWMYLHHNGQIRTSICKSFCKLIFEPILKPPEWEITFFFLHFFSYRVEFAQVSFILRSKFVFKISYFNRNVAEPLLKKLQLSDINSKPTVYTFVHLIVFFGQSQYRDHLARKKKKTKQKTKQQQQIVQIWVLNVRSTKYLVYLTCRVGFGLQGGLTTRDEMCETFLYYYPRLDIMVCDSFPNVNQMFNMTFDIDRGLGECVYVLDRIICVDRDS